MSKYILSDIFRGNYAITQRYNDNPQNYPMFPKPGHEGVDWGMPNGVDTLAPFNGLILRDTLLDKDYGNFLVVWDPVQKCAVWYCHLKDTPVNIGDRVTKGQVVAHSNNTGHSTGSHLHVNFVETDALGNRLNMNNGKQGFLDILNPNLVAWQLASTPIPPTPQPPSNVFTPQTKIPGILLGQTEDMEIQAIKSELDRIPGLEKDLANERETNRRLTEAISKAVEALKQFKEMYEQERLNRLTPIIPPKTVPVTNNGLFTTLFQKLFKNG